MAVKINQNVIVYRGDDLILRFTIEDTTSLAGFVAYWNLCTTTSGTSVLSKTSPSSGITISGNNVDVTLSKNDTRTRTIGLYYHELQLKDSTNKSVVSAVGEFDLREPILKRSA